MPLSSMYDSVYCIISPTTAMLEDGFYLVLNDALVALIGNGTHITIPIFLKNGICTLFCEEAVVSQANPKASSLADALVTLEDFIKFRGYKPQFAGALPKTIALPVG